jgi:hypothetical protein
MTGRTIPLKGDAPSFERGRIELGRGYGAKRISCLRQLADVEPAAWGDQTNKFAEPDFGKLASYLEPKNLRAHPNLIGNDDRPDPGQQQQGAASQYTQGKYSPSAQFGHRKWQPQDAMF